MCAFLGITAAELTSPAPYIRVLAFNDTGRQILKAARQTGTFLNVGEAADAPYQALETKAERLYGLFCADASEAPYQADSRRVCYHKGD